MERARSTWSDERLDDLVLRMENGFNRVDEDLRSMSARIDGRIDSLSARLDMRIDAIDRRLDVLQRTMLQLGGGMLVAILATLVSVLATRA
jgi:hypothetical protein